MAAHSSPEILLLDENLSVGDENFREKSYKKIKEFYKSGKTIIMASHQMSAVRENCSRVIWLSQGKVVKEGSPAKIIAEYEGNYR